jgi:hypothetical protein
MSAGENLKCQFCELKFSSTYKIIPHTFFGHKKKISKMVAKQGEIRILCPCAPAGCQFVESRLVARTASQEEIFHQLACSLLGIESHVNTQHTGEERLTSCPYCSLVLDNIIYWEHLQEHMANSAAGAGGTAESPVKVQGGGDQPPPKSAGDVARDSQNIIQDTLELKPAASVPAETEKPAMSVSVAESKTEVNSAEVAGTGVPENSSTISAHSAAGGEFVHARAAEKLAGGKNVETEPIVRKETETTQPVNSVDAAVTVKSPVKRPRTPPGLPPAERPSSPGGWQTNRDETDRPVSPLLGTPKAPEELAADTIPFKVSVPIKHVEMYRYDTTQCCGSGNQCFFTPWIRDEFFPYPGSF